jgi:hypothetical protein
LKARLSICKGLGRRRIGIECKASPALKVTLALRTAIQDLRLEAAYNVAPVQKSWLPAPGLHVIPVSHLASIVT